MSACRLLSFHPRHAAEVATWALSAGEARAWAGQATPWPVPASVILSWREEPDVRSWLLVEDEAPVAYGELWVDVEEQEVELGRLIVRPDARGRGVGRLLVASLLRQAARTQLPTALVRVVPDNAAALACYRHAGFTPVDDEERRRFNAGQPLAYEWLRHDLRAPD
ncbi:MAG: GNAT family N-acetyltransferase [Actinobacteria bacterium]|nr:GNAT family N-acetyltransferase [Actinomycetota bacterium]